MICVCVLIGVEVGVLDESVVCVCWSDELGCLGQFRRIVKSRQT